MGTQEALAFVAEQTGGILIANTNDLSGAIGRALDDQRGYYLLGYQAPDGATTTGWDQNRIKVQVKRRGLRVRARQGFFGPADPAREPGERAPIHCSQRRCLLSAAVISRRD
jgi:VWFA-related protein